MSNVADASRFTRRKRRQLQPCLILLTGVAGTGKTSLAKEILGRLWAVYLDNNHIVNAFFPHVRNGRAYEKLRPRFYQALYTIAEVNLKAGNSVLLDAPHVKEMQDSKWRASIKSLASRAKAKTVIIRCFCSEAVLRSRLQARGEARDRWKLAHWEAFLRQQPVKVRLSFPHLDLDTEKNLPANVSTAVRYILSPSANEPDSVRCSCCLENKAYTRRHLHRLINAF